IGAKRDDQRLAAAGELDPARGGADQAAPRGVDFGARRRAGDLDGHQRGGGVGGGQGGLDGSVGGDGRLRGDGLGRGRGLGGGCRLGKGRRLGRDLAAATAAGGQVRGGRDEQDAGARGREPAAPPALLRQRAGGLGGREHGRRRAARDGLRRGGGRRGAYGGTRGLLER